MSEHHDHQCRESGDVDRAVATGCGAAGDLGCVRCRFGERHDISMPGRGPLWMSRTTRRAPLSPLRDLSPRSKNCVVTVH